MRAGPQCTGPATLLRGSGATAGRPLGGQEGAWRSGFPAARSRILDADFAAETARLTRGQILQQAGIAVLAQANAAPQNVLALLQ